MRVLPSVLASAALAAGSASATAAPTAVTTAANDRIATAAKCRAQLLDAFQANGSVASAAAVAALDDAATLQLFQHYGAQSKYSEGSSGNDVEGDCSTAPTSSYNINKDCDVAGTDWVLGTTAPAVKSCGMSAHAFSSSIAGSYLLTAADNLQLFGDDTGASSPTNAGGSMKIAAVSNPADLSLAIGGTATATTGMRDDKHCVINDGTATNSGLHATAIWTASSAAGNKLGLITDVEGLGNASGASAGSNAVGAAGFVRVDGHVGAHACTAAKYGQSMGAVFNACTSLFAQEAGGGAADSTNGIAGTVAGWKVLAQQIGYTDVLSLGHKYATMVAGSYIPADGNVGTALTSATSGGTSKCGTTATTAGLAGSAKFIGDSPCEAALKTIVIANGGIKSEAAGTDTAYVTGDVLTGADNPLTPANKLVRWSWLWSSAASSGTSEADTLALKKSFRSYKAESLGDVVAAVYHIDAYAKFGTTMGTLGNPHVTLAVDANSAKLACDWVEIAATGLSAAAGAADSTKYACQVKNNSPAGTPDNFAIGDVIMGDSTNTGGYADASDSDHAKKLVTLKAKLAAGATFIVLQKGTFANHALSWTPKDSTTCTAGVRTALKTLMTERCFIGTNGVNWPVAGSFYHAFTAALLETTPKNVQNSGTALKVNQLGIYPNMLKGCGWAAPTCAKGSGGTTVAACATCAKGKYNGVLTMTDCIDCAKGKYADETGRSAAAHCKSCPKGKWAAAGAESCTNCVAGKYGDTLGLSAAAACKACTSGNTTAGASSSTNCTVVDNTSTGTGTKASGALSRFSALAITSLLALIAV